MLFIKFFYDEFFIPFVFFCFLSLVFAKDPPSSAQIQQKPSLLVKAVKNQKPSAIAQKKSKPLPKINISKNQKLSAPAKDKSPQDKNRRKKRLPSSDPYLIKEDLLPENYDQAKYPAKFLTEKLEAYLSKIHSVCSNKDKLPFLDFRINRLRDFLKEKLQEDPYMDIKIEQLFRDILMLIGENSSEKTLKSEDFKKSYAVAFGIRGKVKAEDYPKWADQIEKALICAEEEKSSN